MATTAQEPYAPSASTTTRQSLVGAAGAVAATGGLASVLVVLAGAVGWATTGRLLAAVVALTVVHAGIATLAVPRTGVAVRLLLATVLGLATAGIAVWLSGLAGWFSLRWIVVAAPGLAWLHPTARTPCRPPAAGIDQQKFLLRWGPLLWGLAAAWFLAARSLHGYVEPLTAPATWRSFYVDIPWHIALTAESLERAPQVYPWIPDVPIGYSWLFFGTLGLIGNLTGASATQLVLAVGPACLALLVPAALAACTWVVSRSRLAVAVAPLLFALTRAPLFSHTEGLQLTPQWVLINRDSTNVMVLSLVILLVLQLRDGTGRRPGALLLLALFLVTFSAAGSRGGAVPAVLGAAGLPWLLSLLQGKDRHATSWSLAVTVAAVLGATLGVTRSSGSFRLDPLSFLPVQVVGEPSLRLGTLASVAVMLFMVGAIASAAGLMPYTRPALPALVGAALAGVLGTALFGHPSFSQLYFFHAAWPAIVVGLAVVVTLALHRLGPLVLVLLAVAVLAVQMILQPSVLLPPLPWTVRVAAAGGLLLVLGGTVVALLARRHGWARTLTLAVPAAVIALQPWSLPGTFHHAVTVEPVETSTTVSDTQLAVLEELRQRSDPDDLVATNKHCLRGNVTGGGCDARWFAVAAFAERRVLMEGWSYDYTWTSSGTDNLEPYWDPALLQANDGFIADPSQSTCRVLEHAGVDWIYVDHREPWSPRITEYADPVADAGDASLYRLTRDCG